MSRNYEGKFTTAEAWAKLRDGSPIYTKTWKPTGAIKARVIIIHGFTDHINMWLTFNEILAANGFEVRGFDQRGWGRSVRKQSEKGLTGPTTQVMDDMTCFINMALPSPVPVFLYGHSMGGGQVLTYASAGPPVVLKQLNGILAEAPLINTAPKSRPSGLLVAAGHFFSNLLPRFQMVEELDQYLVSRDKSIGEAYKADPLVHNTGTLAGLSGMLRRASNLDTGKAPINDTGDLKSIFVAHGTGDGICDEPSTARVFEKYIHIKDKTYRSYDGWYHTLHAEIGEDKYKYAQDVMDWMSARLK